MPFEGIEIMKKIMRVYENGALGLPDVAIWEHVPLRLYQGITDSSYRRIRALYYQDKLRCNPASRIIMY